MGYDPAIAAVEADLVAEARQGSDKGMADSQQYQQQAAAFQAAGEGDVTAGEVIGPR